MCNKGNCARMAQTVHQMAIDGARSHELCSQHISETDNAGNDNSVCMFLFDCIYFLEIAKITNKYVNFGPYLFVYNSG